MNKLWKRVLSGLLFWVLNTFDPGNFRKARFVKQWA